MKIEVSTGEIFDKLSILEIKKRKIKGRKLINVEKEWKYLKKKVDAFRNDVKSKENEKLHKYLLQTLIGELLIVNLRLWEIEDEIRKCEEKQDFGNKFIELARQVYITNDKRSMIKNKINLHTKSKFIEEKSYKKY